MQETESNFRAMRIGNPEPRLDAYDKALGKTIYASDFQEKDMLWVGVKRAGIKHARLTSINTSDAAIIEGVTAVLTHEDIPGSKIHGVVRADRPVLVFDKIRFNGDPIALVVAEKESILNEALKRISFEFEALQPVTDPQEALSPSSALVHEDNPDGNILLQADLGYGNPDNAEKNSDVIVKGTFETQVQEHAYLETESGWARMQEDGALVICCSTQTPFRDSHEVAHILKMDHKDIRVIAPFCGGAFGGKDSLTVQAYLGLAAIHSRGRPVRMVWSRDESFSSSTKRHSAKMDYRLGAKSDGTLHFLDVNILMDTGPYDFLGGVVLTLAVEHAGGPYRIPNSRVRGRLVYTNNSIGGAFRGFGVPQVTAAIEQMIDMLASELGICSLELRKKNALRQGDKTFLGKQMNCSTGMVECLENISENPAWKNRHQWKSEAGKGMFRGVGLASMIHGMGYGPFVKDYANAKVELTESGKIRIYSGVVDMGQGNSSTYAQIAGHILNQSAEQLELIQPDTYLTLPGCSSSASRTTYTFGMALIGACEKLREGILDCAAGKFGLTESVEPELRPGGVVAPDGGHVTLEELFQLMPEELKTCVHYFEAPTSSELLTNDENLRMHGLPHEIFSFAAHAVFVEIDGQTGEVNIDKYLAVSDCGAVLNPQIYEQQVHGAIAQGIGYALMESYSTGPSGFVPGGFSDYLIPTACDIPRIDCAALDMFEPTGPFGLKGLGEIATAGPLPAISNAVYDACGARIVNYPITAEKIYREIRRIDRPWQSPNSSESLCMESPKKLFSYEFTAICLIVFLNYCNIALFFYFTEYLSSISIPHEWWGFLISVFSLVILILRPVISPFSNAHNSRKWLIGSTLGIMTMLCCYGLAHGVVSMTAVRVFHGVAYVVMTVAITSRMVVSIPRERSTLAFSVISVISLLPYAIIPPMVVFATEILGGFPAAMVAAAALMGLTFPLMTLMPADLEKTSSQSASTLSVKEIRSNLRNPNIVAILLIAVVVWTAYAPVFFFLNSFASSIGVSNPGFFFTVSSVAEIVVRLVGGGLMDKGNKPYLLMVAVLWLGGCYAVLGFVKSVQIFFLMGLLMGIGWGLIMPLLSSIVFDISDPRFRAFNTNITFQMFQMGFFIGPIAGGYFIEAGGFHQFLIFAAVSLVFSVAPAFVIFRDGRYLQQRN